MSEDEGLFMGNLFGLIEDNNVKEVMDVQTFLKQNEVNEEVYY